MDKLSVTVYRSDVDCTNNGVTSPKRRFHGYNLYLQMPSEEQILADVARECAPLLLDRREGTNFPPIARPLTAYGEDMAHCVFAGGLCGMAGGNFVYSSGSAFREQVSAQPISVHDRFESQKEYGFLSQ